MIGVDTNILIRLITGDDPEQTEMATRLFQSNETIFIADTVILETEWVLRHAYGFTPSRIHHSLSELCGLSNIRLSDPDRIFTALSHYAKGMDFADALHLSWCEDCQALYTFDIRFRKKEDITA